MAKRSPLLGYNHNVRHRGVVFHVQTEDSGVDNPHIFTHLFNGGVILSSRRLDYDPGSDEDVVKSLMQAQHKALLKDLKAAVFDEKIDRYLVDNPDLEPSEATKTAAALAVVAAAAPEVAPAPAAAPAAIAATTERRIHPSLAEAASREDERQPRDTLVAAPTFDDGDGLTSPRATAFGVAPPTARPEGRRPTVPPVPPLGSRTAAEPSRPTSAPRVTVPPPVSPPATPRREPGAVEFRPPTGEFKPLRQAAGAPPGEARAMPLDPARPVEKPVSVQFQRPPAQPAAPPAPPATPRRKPADDDRGVLGSESEVSAAFRAISYDDVLSDAAVVHSPAPASAKDPPGARPTTPGAYSEGRTPSGNFIPVAVDDGPTERMDADLKQTLRGHDVSRVISPAPPRAPVGAQPGGKAKQPPRQGVVVQRAAVIVSAPPKVVGGPARPASSAGPGRPGEPARPAARRAREDARGLFGKDLISEKSLDEVILAYLSEDASEEK